MAQVTFAADTTPSLVDLDANFTELYSKTAWATTGIGYATGSGGTVTQATSKSTGVTLNKTNGQIVTNSAALASNTAVSFSVTNSTVAATDVVTVMISGAVADSKNYNVWAHVGSAGSFNMNLKNVSAGSLSEAVTISFAVIKAVTA